MLSAGGVDEDVRPLGDVEHTGKKAGGGGRGEAVVCAKGMRGLGLSLHSTSIGVDALYYDLPTRKSHDTNAASDRR